VPTAITDWPGNWKVFTDMLFKKRTILK